MPIFGPTILSVSYLPHPLLLHRTFPYSLFGQTIGIESMNFAYFIRTSYVFHWENCAKKSVSSPEKKMRMDNEPFINHIRMSLHNAVSIVAKVSRFSHIYQFHIEVHWFDGGECENVRNQSAFVFFPIFFVVVRVLLSFLADVCPLYITQIWYQL